MPPATTTQTILEDPPVLRLRPAPVNDNAISVDGIVPSDAAEEITRVAQNIRNVRRNFIQVAGALVRFDGARFRDKDGNILALSQEWDQLKRRFDGCVMLSLAKANNAVVIMESISTVLDEAAEAPLENNLPLRQEFLAEIKNFSKALEDGEPGVRDVQAQFRELGDDVQLFKSKIAVTLQAAGSALRAELSAATGPIPQLQQELDELRSRSSKCCSATDKKRAKELQEEIAQRLRRKEAAEAQLKRLEEYSAELEAAMPFIEDTAQRIYILADIWLGILMQTKGLLDFMKLNFSSSSTVGFRRKLAQLKSKYAELTRVLSLYVAQAGLAAR